MKQSYKKQRGLGGSGMADVFPKCEVTTGHVPRPARKAKAREQRRDSFIAIDDKTAWKRTRTTPTAEQS